MLARIHVSSRVIRFLACLLYMAGLSYRMNLQTGIKHTCCRSVHHQVQQLRGITSNVRAKKRSFVATDETKQKIDRKQIFVWSAIDVETKELLAIWASYERSSSAAFVFDTMKKKPVILVDGS